MHRAKSLKIQHSESSMYMGKQERNIYGFKIRTTYLIFGEDENKVRHTTLVISRRRVDSDH